VRRCQRDHRGLHPAGDPAHGPRQVVVLLGIDGSGKTTTATALAAAARKAGVPAIVLRNRSGRRWMARTSARCGLEVPVRWADRFETSVRILNVLVSQARTRRRKSLVVIDRHLVCQLVLRRGRDLPPGRWLPWLACRSLRPHTVVVLDVPAKIAQQRILRRGEDHESLDYLRTARTAYLELASAWGWNVVDATAPTEVLVTRIIDAADL
jgi:dTMP kinase